MTDSLHFLHLGTFWVVRNVKTWLRNTFLADLDHCDPPSTLGLLKCEQEQSPPMSLSDIMSNTLGNALVSLSCLPYASTACVAFTEAKSKPLQLTNVSPSTILQDTFQKITRNWPIRHAGCVTLTFHPIDLRLLRQKILWETTPQFSHW